jgi:hypothetical protein
MPGAVGGVLNGVLADIATRRPPLDWRRRMQADHARMGGLNLTGPNRENRGEVLHPPDIVSTGKAVTVAPPRYRYSLL